MKLSSGLDPFGRIEYYDEPEPEWFPNEGDRRWWRETHRVDNPPRPDVDSSIPRTNNPTERSDNRKDDMLLVFIGMLLLAYVYQSNGNGPFRGGYV